MERIGRRRPAVGDALLQQADARKGCTSTSRRSPRARALPIVLYNVPGRTGVNLDVAHDGRGCRRFRNIVGIKEASGDLVADVRDHSRRLADDFIVLSGDDPVTVAAMAVGGRGVISVASNEAPAEMAQIVELCEKGDFAARAQAAPLAAAAHPGELRRIQPDPVQGGDGGDGAARGELPAAARAAERRRRARR